MPRRLTNPIMSTEASTSAHLIPTTPILTRTRSVSQPMRPGFPTSPSSTNIPLTTSGLHARTPSRSKSSNFIHNLNTQGGIGVVGSPVAAAAAGVKGRARSGSLMTVTEVGGDDMDAAVDRLGVGVNENAQWVNGPGAWLIHPVMILATKILVDAIPRMTQDVSWTIVNLGYMAVSFLMFHHVTGVPFESSLTTGGAYDDLTLWEQIDSGAQYTPAKKWLTSVPIFLFLISTHYTKYDFLLFGINFAACVFVLFPKLPVLHRLRFHFLPADPTLQSTVGTPTSSRPPSPRLGSIAENIRVK